MIEFSLNISNRKVTISAKDDDDTYASAKFPLSDPFINMLSVREMQVISEACLSAGEFIHAIKIRADSINNCEQVAAALGRFGISFTELVDIAPPPPYSAPEPSAPAMHKIID